MEVNIKGFIYHKDKEEYSDCHDRIGFNTVTNRFAISDGVSSSFLPGLWAEALVNDFVRQDVSLQNPPIALAKTQDVWLKEKEEMAKSDGHKWVVKKILNKLISAAATFVGLRLYFKNGVAYWEAAAIGDSFLFYIPADVDHKNDEFYKSIKSVPSVLGFVFNDFPEYIDSIKKEPKGSFKFEHKQLLAPGKFLIMTDALAEWFVQNRSKALKNINNWASQDDFAKAIKYLRNRKKIANDDSSIIIIELSEDNEQKFNYSNINITNIKELSKSRVIKDNIKTTPNLSSNLSMIDIIKKMKK